MPPFPRTLSAFRCTQSLLRSPPFASYPQSQPSRRPSLSNVLNPILGPRRHLSNTSSAMAEHSEHGGYGSHYEPPHGWLWGIRPGEKYEKEGWETIWYWGFYGSLIVATIAYAWKPDTSIETWALEEAKRRLQVEGILPEDE